MSRKKSRGCDLDAHCARFIVETLEQRCLLSVNHSDPAYIWSHLKPAFEHDLAIVEYNNPDFQAALDADLAVLGIAPIPAQPGSLPNESPAKSNLRHPRHHTINLFHAKKPKPHRLIVTAPMVTDAKYYYDQSLPNQFSFTFDQDVTAANWDSALTIIDLNTGATIPATGG